jgi:uncharacterized heparinase superfamily protein
VTAVAPAYEPLLASLSPRSGYQRHVATLLEEIERRRHQLLVLHANGALPAGLRDLKAELQAVRDELARAIRSGGVGWLNQKT